MSTFLKSLTEPSSPDPAMRYIEKDEAIVRGVTLALCDFSNPASNLGNGNIPCDAVVPSLVNGGGNITVKAGNIGIHYFAPVYNGTIRSAGVSYLGNSIAVLSLPVDFCQPAGVTRSLMIFWARMPKTGWVANQMYGLWNVGSSLANAATNQHGAWWQTDAAGVISKLRYRLSNQAAGQTDLDINPGAVLDLFSDGSLHQVGFAFEALGGGLAKSSIWIDGEQVAESAAFAATSLNLPALKTGAFGYGGGVGASLNANAALDIRFGRPSAHNLSSRPDLTVAQMLAADMAAAQGYLS